MSKDCASHYGEITVPVLSPVDESDSKFHSCSHCDDLVIDTVKNWNTPTSVLLEYTKVSNLLQAFHECFFIRQTLVPWQSDLAGHGMIPWPKRLLWFVSRTKRRPIFQLHISFVWSYPKNPKIVLEAVELQWHINGESRDARLFLVNVKNGESTNSISSSTSILM
jgi:hypothetical protein